MTAIFTALASRFPSAAKCAAALGMTRQAYCQAQKRRRLSESKAMLAGKLIGISPARALFFNATGQDIPAPKCKATPHPAPQIQDEKKPAHDLTNELPNTNYTKRDQHKKSGQNAVMQKLVHVIPQTKKRLFEIDCVKWMLCVPRISPDSPRFIHYFSRWVVPEKIAAAQRAGTFAETVKNCPLFSPELTNYIQAGIDEYFSFVKSFKRPPESSVAKLFRVNDSAPELPLIFSMAS